MAFTKAGRYDENLLRLEATTGYAKVVTDADVYVYDADGTTLSDLWTDEDKGTTAANPVSPDAAGNVEFFAVPGKHVLKIWIDGSLLRTDTVSVPYDPGEIDEDAIPAGGTAKQILSRDAAGSGSAEWQDPDAIDVLDKGTAQTVSGVKTFSTHPSGLDHGQVGGLDDDDHPQYHNNARHDAHDHSAAAASIASADLADHTKTTHDALGLDHGSLAGNADDDHSQYSRADGTRPFTGEVAGVAPTVDASLATKGYVDSATHLDEADLTDDTVSALSTFETWGTEQVSFADPGRAVKVVAWLSGDVRISSAVLPRASVGLEVSLDNGSTWTRSKTPNQDLDFNPSSLDRASISATHLVSGTPTGTVLVRAVIRQDGGTAGDVTFAAGHILAQMLAA